MKEVIIRTVVILKRISFLYRLAGIVVGFVAIFSFGLPDLKFNIQSGKPVEMTLAEFFKTPAEDLPLYLKIKDAVVPAGSYVHLRKEKTNSLEGIYYPVYPKNEVQASFDFNKVDSLNKVISKDSLAFSIAKDSTGKMTIVQNTDRVPARLVIYDTHVTDKELDSSYFSSPAFTIEGKYSGLSLPNDVRDLFTSSNIKISDNVIVLKRGDKVMSTSTAIMVIILGFLVSLLCVLTFLSNDKLVRLSGFQGSWEDYVLSRANLITLPSGTQISTTGNRALSYIIDFAIIWAISFALLSQAKELYLAGLAISFIYFLVCDILLKGCSVGKLVLKQQVVSTKGGDLTKEAIVIRNIIKAISNSFPLIFLFVFTNDSKQAIHDLAAKTVVVNKPKDVI
ncbi:RDD family protein [Emticicia sp. 17c]|uniref:RDD family protein n=1 Tax=Emticicia sp. 17c TaxID=3127704 RepID=UPI00301DBAF3